MMGWIPSSLKALRRPSPQSRRVPKSNRSLILEDLEGRRLLSHAIQSFVTLPDAVSNMISGPGGDLWVAVNPDTGNSNVVIDRISLNGSVTSFPVPGAEVDMPLTAGPDGNLWFALAPSLNGSQNDVIVGKITPAGAVTEFPVPDTSGLPFFVDEIVSGPGGEVWFGMNGTSPAGQPESFIGQVTTAGAIKIFPVSASGPDKQLFSLAAGPDGNLWFTESFGGDSEDVGRMTPNGVVTHFATPGHISGAVVASGPSGNLVLLGQNPGGQNEVFRVSTAGGITRFKIPAAISSVFSNYVSSADGSVWFADIPGVTIGRITASGPARAYNLIKAIGRGIHDFESMALGPDGELYLLDNFNTMHLSGARIYRISPTELTPMR
jgi:streptogramin lyase